MEVEDFAFVNIMKKDHVKNIDNVVNDCDNIN